MKKIVLLALVLGVGLMATAQRSVQLKDNLRQHAAIQKMMVGIEPIKSTSVVHAQPADIPFLPADRNTNVVSVIDIGTSANGYSYGYAGGQKSIVWADPNLNVVTNFHRMGGALDPGGYSGDLGYDISTNGGNTFTNMVEIYQAETNAGGEYYVDAARYPNHGIYNPAGNTDINNAFLTFHAATLDGSNSNTASGWGGYGFGVANLGDPSIRTKNLWSSTSTVKQYIPDAFDMTNTGEVFVVDVNQDWTSGSLVYLNSLIVNKGTWDADLEDFVYTQELIDAFVDAETSRPAHVSVAFGPDGQTGYISMVADNGTTDVISGAKGFYPVIYKTTDGGATWSDPTGIQLAGPNGIDGIVNGLLTDEQIAELYEVPLPAREEIPYTTAFDHDIAVDANGNLHIGVVIGVVGSSNYSIVSASNFFAAYDIYTTDGGLTWEAKKLGSIRQLRGSFPDDTFTEDNRIQITTSFDRRAVFVSWLDTDLEEQEDNNRPNIFSRGLKLNDWGYWDMTCSGGANTATNVTLFSVAMWNATFGSVASYALYSDGKYTIPMTYQPLVDNNPINPVQYKYIKDFFFTDADFCIVGAEEIKAASVAQVSQNFPNPFTSETYVNVQLTSGNSVGVAVYNITGQKVYEQSYGYQPAGSFTMTLKSENMPSGIYFYTVSVGAEKITRKMMVN
jgi:hypothetical protein